MVKNFSRLVALVLIACLVNDSYAVVNAFTPDGSFRNLEAFSTQGLSLPAAMSRDMTDAMKGGSLAQVTRMVSPEWVRRGMARSAGIAILAVLGANMLEAMTQFAPATWHAYLFWLANAAIPLGRVLRYQALAFPIAVAVLWAGQKWGRSVSAIPSLLLLAGWVAWHERIYHWSAAQWAVVLTLWNPEWIFGIAVPIIVMNTGSTLRGRSRDQRISKKETIKRLAVTFLVYIVLASSAEPLAEKARNWLGLHPFGGIILNRTA